MSHKHPEITWDNCYAMLKAYEPSDKILEIHNIIRPLFPLTLFYWREKAGKQRKLNKVKSADMNNYSIMKFICPNPDSFMTCQRSAKHRGFPHLVAAIESLPREKEISLHYNRILSLKYKNWHELLRVRPQHLKGYDALINKLINTYPCDATGQTRLI